MTTSLIAYPRIIFKQAAEPEKIAGTFWLDTDDSKLYYCDGLNWINMSDTESTFTTQIMENALEILNIQAAETLTATDSANIVSEIYSDADGYRNTIDAGNTTANFSTNKYINITGESDATEYNSTSVAAELVKTYTMNSYIEKVVNEIKYESQYMWCKIVFNYTDESAAGEVEEKAYTTSYVSKTYTNPNPEKEVSTIQMYLRVESGGNAHAINQVISGLPTDLIIQTDAQTISAGYTNFQIFTFGGSTAGTATLNYDVSFDNGTNYQTGILENVATEIDDIGTQLILKQNLNAGASEGEASAKGYGVLLW